jgi:hypothetical protein
VFTERSKPECFINKNPVKVSLQRVNLGTRELTISRTDKQLILLFETLLRYMVPKNWDLYEDLNNRSSYLQSQPIAVAARSKA